MKNKIEFHKSAWKCPICGKWKRVKNTGCSNCIARCCGVKVIVGVIQRKVWSTELNIISVEKIK